MNESRGRDAILSAFDRLFDTAASKLQISCTLAEKDEVKRNFAERVGNALQFDDLANSISISDAAIEEMKAAIEGISPAEIAGHLAAGPLARRVQETMQSITRRTAEQRMLEHYLSQADDSYGGS